MAGHGHKFDCPMQTVIYDLLTIGIYGNGNKKDFYLEKHTPVP